MSLPLISAIAFDNIGCNDPEVQMTICLWVSKALHFINFI
jgi:hypothetical protein